MTSKEKVLEIVKANPGFTGFEIHRELVRQSRVGYWFGDDSIIAVLFGPSVGEVYCAIWDLEEDGALTSKWAEVTPGKARPRYYRIPDAPT